MKPIDFVMFDGDSSPNTPVEKIAKAMKKTYSNSRKTHNIHNPVLLLPRW